MGVGPSTGLKRTPVFFDEERYEERNTVEGAVNKRHERTWTAAREWTLTA
ncbi:hypothetical protein ACIRD6_38020 [Streptomyces sp. NPDC102473]